MGWSGEWQYGRKPMREVRRFIREDICKDGQDLDYAQFKVVHLSVQFGKAFVALQHTPKIDGVVREDKQLTYAMVILWRQTKDEFMYKLMDESCGPVEVKGCPKSLIKKLTPIGDSYGDRGKEWASNWRESVLSQYKTGI